MNSSSAQNSWSSRSDDAGMLRAAALAGSALLLTYRSEGGRTSARTVEPRQVWSGRNGVGYFKAWCRLRGEERTFRIDRILSLEQACASPVTATIIPFPSAAAAPSPPPPRPRTVPTASPAPTPKAAEHSSVSPGSIICGIVIFCVLAASPTPFGELLRAMLNQGQGSRTVPTIPYVLPAPAVAPIVKPKPATPAPTPAPLVRKLTQRGVAVVHTANGDRHVWEAPERGWRESSRRALFLRINREVFRKTTGIANEKLEGLYADADSDRDGLLSWKELEAFQRIIHEHYVYIANPLALRPDEFIAQGGGDCEDWALVTCGLLRFWDWEGYVGTLSPPGRGSGHAVALVRSNRAVPGYESFQFDKPVVLRGRSFPAGHYIPIDYQQVGSLSNVVGKDWVFDGILVPEAIYGLTM